MTRAEKYLKEHPDAEQTDGFPTEAHQVMLCARDVGFNVNCRWRNSWSGVYSCEDCWREEVE